MSDIVSEFAGIEASKVAAEKRAIIQENLKRELSSLFGEFSHCNTPVKTSDSVVRVSIFDEEADHDDFFAEILVVWHPNHGNDIDRLLLSRSSKYVVVIYADRFRVDVYRLDGEVGGYLGWRYSPAQSRIDLIDDSDNECVVVWACTVSDLYKGRPVFENPEKIEAFV